MCAQVARQNDRIAVTMPLEVVGQDTEGRPFVQLARTLVLSRRGATIVLPQKLVPKQELLIRSVGTDKQEVVRVVKQTGKHGRETVYYVASLSADGGLWDVEFPPASDLERAIAQALLECTRCQSRVVSCLNEIEFLVFAADQALSRYCRTCDASSTWKPVSLEPLNEPKMPTAEKPRTVDKRKEVRAKVNLLACVRQAGHEEEVVVCENISHGGLCIRGKRAYPEGTKVEIAVPYSPRAASVFVFAWVVHSRLVGKGDLFRHGVMYRMPKARTRN